MFGKQAGGEGFILSVAMTLKEVEAYNPAAVALGDALIKYIEEGKRIEYSTHQFALDKMKAMNISANLGESLYPTFQHLQSNHSDMTLAAGLVALKAKQYSDSKKS